MKRFLPMLLIAVVLSPLLLLLPVDANNTMWQAVPRRDTMTGGALTIDVEHSMIHDGDHFTAHFEDGTPTNVGEETAIGFLTPPAASGRIHLIVAGLANDESILEIREAPTVNANQGTALAIFNRHRGNATLSTIINHQTPAVAATLTSYTVAQAAAADLSGTAILHSETLAVIGAGPFASALNVKARGQREFILNSEEDYVIILTTTTINTTRHEITLDWYEHVDSNY